MERKYVSNDISSDLCETTALMSFKDLKVLLIPILCRNMLRERSENPYCFKFYFLSGSKVKTCKKYIIWKAWFIIM